MLGHRKLDLDDWLAILRRRRLLILLPAILCPILALAVTFFIQPRYLSQTLIIVDEQKVPDDYVKPILSPNLDGRLASMREQILSRSRIGPIIERYNLYNSNHNTMDDRIDLARKAIVIQPIRSDMGHGGGPPGFFISFTANDPHIAQHVCSEITSIFLKEDLRSRAASAEGTAEFLKSQLDDAKRSLDEQDHKLAAFQRQYVGKLPGEETPNLNMLTSLNTQLEAANQTLARMEQDKTYQESLLSEQTSAVSGTGDDSLTQSSQPQALELELQNALKEEADLTSHYTAAHPDVIAIRRRIAELRREIAADPAATARPGSTPARVDSPATQQLRAQLRAADAGIASKRREQQKLQTAINMYQDRISSSPLVNEQYKELTRDYETAKKFYDDLLTKMNQSKMANDLERQQQGEQFRIFDAANLPDSPTFPKRWIFLLGGLLFGLSLGLGVAALLEYKDTSLRSERDIWVFTRLPTLAVLSVSNLPASRYNRLSSGENRNKPVTGAGA